MCPGRSTASSAQPVLCTSIVVTSAAILVSPAPPGDGTRGHVRLFLTPGDGRLTVTVAGAPDEGGTAVLTGHRAKGPCGGWLYDPVRLTASGAPVIASH
jgi:hypothetical protein